MITTFCVVTDMGTSSIIIKTLINICNENKRNNNNIIMDEFGIDYLCPTNIVHLHLLFTIIVSYNL